MPLNKEIKPNLKRIALALNNPQSWYTIKEPKPVLERWGFSLPLLPDLFWLRVVEVMGQIDPFENLVLFDRNTWNHIILYKQLILYLLLLLYFLFYFQFLTTLHWVFTQDLAWGKVVIIYILSIYVFCCLFLVIFFSHVDNTLLRRWAI